MADEKEVIATPYDSVSLQRGLGFSGKRIEIIEATCEDCHFDRKIRLNNVNPELSDTQEDRCLNPACPVYHNGDWDHLFPISSVSQNKF